MRSFERSGYWRGLTKLREAWSAVTSNSLAVEALPHAGQLLISSDPLQVFGRMVVELDCPVIIQMEAGGKTSAPAKLEGA